MKSLTSAAFEGNTARPDSTIEFPRLHRGHSWTKSADTSIRTALRTDNSCASSVTSTTSASSVDTQGETLYSSHTQQPLMSGMTTYYLYNDGKVVGTSHINPATHASREPSSPSAYERRGDIVGAYLARRAMTYPARATSSEYQSQEWPHTYDGQQNDEIKVPESNEGDHWSEENDDSQDYTLTFFPDHSSTVGYMGLASQSDRNYPYPDPDFIRYQYSLHNLLPYIQPERKLNAFNGMCMDIVEQDTHVVFADDIPKKLLVLFLGRKVVNKFIQTTERDDNVNWRGRATRQILFLPRGQTSKVAMRILIAWMFRACQRSTMGCMQPIRIPGNTFAACTLAQTMELFELRKDAYRIDLYISQNHFARPVFPVELKTLWNCLGETSKYVYAAIKAVGNRVRDMEAGSAVRAPWLEELGSLLEAHPQIKARVYDADLNERYRPVFGTRWMYSERGNSGC
ncbi:hypothetical protein T440DRAFT_464501 [Plenodomus tracheiphilus IPT5]|uniref:Uncharacterized protein n=1 Tax=Plenodomus tracheiphilus IPT5 TaxID=1408161 RepID=A0A6A7BIZ7_9PLEO|nr:hypothetical protein T440DRAFT_464501 [Plenodomus tracheiphilus IPT5]